MSRLQSTLQKYIMKKNYAWMSMALTMALTSVSCSDDKDIEIVETDANYVGQNVGNFTADEWYPGGKLGTTENTTASCYSDQTLSLIHI